eukprot:m.301343 g.301343  ORF g.301343 m.301343 type:complete len:141 (-) comp20139_c0_seq2:1204-1626(-)
MSAKMTTTVPKDAEILKAVHKGGDNDVASSVSDTADAMKACDVSDGVPSTLSVEDKFKYALQFYKKRTAAELDIPYDDNIQLMALAKQAVRGKFVAENETEIGWFDFVGADRRYELVIHAIDLGLYFAVVRRRTTVVSDL